MPTADETLEKLRQAAAKVFKKPPQEIRLESRFREDLGADSLDLVVLVYELENLLGVSLPDQEIRRFRKVGDVVDYVVRNGRA